MALYKHPWFKESTLVIWTHSGHMYHSINFFPLKNERTEWDNKCPRYRTVSSMGGTSQAVSAPLISLSLADRRLGEETRVNSTQQHGYRPYRFGRRFFLFKTLKDRKRLCKQLWFSCLLLHSEPHHENQVRQPVQSATAVWCPIQDKHGNQMIFPTNQSRSSEREKHFPGLTDEPGLEEKALHSQVGQGIHQPPDRDERT